FSVTLATAGSQTITVSDAAAAKTTTVPITVSAAPASRFALATGGNPTVGTSFTFTAAAQDPYGNTDPTYTGTVHFTSSDTSAVLPPNSTLTNGQGSFSATLTKAGSQTITAADSNNALSTTVTVAVSAASATKLVLASSASPVAGTSFGFSVTAQDQFGNTDLAYAGTVHFTSSDTATGVVLPADTMLSNGQATLAATLIKSGAQTITGRDTVTATITGTLSVTVRAATATSLALSTPTTP